jgi:hypothetical protein
MAFLFSLINPANERGEITAQTDVMQQAYHFLKC